MRQTLSERNFDIRRVVTFPAVAVATAGLLAAPAVAVNSQSEHVRARLIADVQSIRPGDAFWVAVYFEIEDDWHLNWVNPGDAGLAPSIEWKLPDGWRVSGLAWPYPHRYRVGPLVIYGYDHALTLIARVTPPDSLPTPADVRIEADVDWLACAEACVPGSASLRLELPVRMSYPQPDSKWKTAFEKAREDQPATSAEWRVQALLEDEDRILLEVRSSNRLDVRVRDCKFIPLYPEVIENGELQVFDPRYRGFNLTLRRARMSLDAPERIIGVLVADPGWDESGKRRAISVDVRVENR